MGASHPVQSKHINPTSGQRVVLPFHPKGACGTAPGFMPGNDALPQQLAAAGVTEKMWQQWRDSYDADVVPKSNQCCFTTGVVLSWMFLIPGLISCLCCDLGKCNGLNMAMKKWLDNVNDDLDKLGLLAKTQTMVSQRDRVQIEVVTLSFSLTREETEKLRAEPFIVMEGDCCSCCLNTKSNASRVV